MVINHRRDHVGNLSNARKESNRNWAAGLDWVQIRDDYAAQMAKQVGDGLTDEETNLWRDNQLHLRSPEDRDRFLEVRALRAANAKTLKALSLTNEARARGGRKSRPRVDVDRMVHLYVEKGMKPDDIAREVGNTVDTVRKNLRRQGVYDPNRHRSGNFSGRRGPGPDQKVVCANGHDLTEPGAAHQLWKTNGQGKKVKNGRICSTCWGH